MRSLGFNYQSRQTFQGNFFLRGGPSGFTLQSLGKTRQAFVWRIPFPLDIMRAFLLVLPVVLSACVSHRGHPVTQREILRQSQVEIARREGWSATAAIFAEEINDPWRRTWKVRAGSLDASDYPRYTGLNFIAGTERELRFSDDGCLIAYIDRASPCLRQRGTIYTEETLTLVERPSEPPANRRYEK